MECLPWDPLQTYLVQKRLCTFVTLMFVSCSLSQSLFASLEGFLHLLVSEEISLAFTADGV